MSQSTLEQAIGACLLPQVRVPGTGHPAGEIVPEDEYLERYPPVGVVLFGYTPEGPREPERWLERVRARCRALSGLEPFACSDMEQGAGLQSANGTRLPPALALATSRGASAWNPGGEARAWIRSAGALTAHEARELGVGLVLAPVADVNTRGDNPIIAVRSFGDEPERAADAARAFLEGLHLGGAAGCAKHFPGHGDTAQDSHLELACVERSLDELRAIEWAPFRALIDAGVDSVMVGHLAVPALWKDECPEGLPATLAPPAVRALREELGFDGAVLSDAMDMGALERESQRFARALAAGLDGLLCPGDPMDAAREIERAVSAGELAAERVHAAAEHMRTLRARLDERAGSTASTGASGAASGGVGLAPGARAGAPAEARELFARELAEAGLVRSAGRWPWRRGAPCEVLMPFPEGLRPEVRAGIAELRSELAGAGDPKGALLPVVLELSAWQGHYGLDSERRGALERRLADLRELGWPVGVLWMGSPQTVPAAWWGHRDWPILLAAGPTPPLIAAAGRWLAGRGDASGSLATSLG